MRCGANKKKRCCFLHGIKWKEIGGTTKSWHGRIIIISAINISFLKRQATWWKLDNYSMKRLWLGLAWSVRTSNIPHHMQHRLVTNVRGIWQSGRDDEAEKMFLNDHNFAVLSTLFQLKAFWPFVRPFISHINCMLRASETERVATQRDKTTKYVFKLTN